jgi:hypothetical protein
MDMTDSTDWFVGSATKSIPTLISGIHDGRIQAIGFRGDDQLLVLVVCDITNVTELDISSVQFHINLHPITPVQVVLIASGRRATRDIRQCTTNERHQLIHIIADCAIDALTFGCPATMRLATAGIQWRKFDDQPIATLVLHDITHDPHHTSHESLIAVCGDPVIHLTDARRQPHWDVDQITHSLKTAAPEPLRHVAWHKHPTGWMIMLNHTSVGIDRTTGDYLITTTPTDVEEG